MKIIGRDRYRLYLERYCSKGKHKLRENSFGVTWCVYCGLLSNGDIPDKLEEDDKIFIMNEDEIHITRTE